MDVRIREATARDIDQLMEWRMETLRHVFGTLEDEEGLYAANLDYYRREIPGGGHVAVFAEVGRETAGCGGICLYREMPSPDNPSGKCAYLMNIYTREAYRDQGVGKAIVSWLVARAGSLGVQKIYLESTEQGRALYESLGFSDMRGYLKL